MSTCRFCEQPLSHTFADLGMSPLCQTQIDQAALNQGETFYPLHAYVCGHCFLVQLDEYVPVDTIFGDDYPYYSSYSASWVEHARQYTNQVTRDHGINASSFVVEIASNDGYLLQHFMEKNIRCLGIEPTAGTANAALGKGIPTENEFFGAATAKRIAKDHGQADLLLGNNVLAHVPELNDFILGVTNLLHPDGLFTFEFPHLTELIKHNQFDTIYHEHFSYFSFSTVNRIFRHHGLEVFDVERLTTHGGSIRIFGQHADTGVRDVSERVGQLLDIEDAVGVNQLSTYSGFNEKVHATKRQLLSFLIESKEQGLKIAGYGAPGKGNTFLNYCGIGTDFLDFTVDRNPVKQGTYTPGSRIPIISPDRLKHEKPDLILILPWNLRDEIESQISYVRDWGCKFVVAIPAVEIF
jgi:hypothetical protein